MALPHIIPIDPILMRHAFDDPDWIFEPKFDGYRGVLYIDGNESYIRSKRNKPLRAFNDLAHKIRKELKVKAAIMDGEITVLDAKTGYSDFKALHSRKGTPVYMAFDLLWLGQRDLTALPLIERKKKLRSLTRAEGWIRFVQHITGQGQMFMDQIVAAGLEGMVAKEKNGIYAPRTNWMKIINPNIKEQRRARSKMFNRYRGKENA